MKDITPARPGEHFAKINPGAEVSFGLTAAAALLPVLAPAGAQAAWDLNHAAAVEDLLKRYMQSLPQAARVTPPRVIIYTGTAYSRACPDSGITAPSYCPGDHTVYLETRLGDAIDARYGDFGALSILAHEFGHAVMSQLNRHPTGKQGELAADSFAGGFARFAEAQGALEAGDLNEARATFAAVGDHNVYSHDHHGTPAERQQAFEQGYAYGFRLPGDNGTQSPPAAPVSPPVTPAPTPPTQPSSPAPAQPTDAGPAVAVLGLSLGVVAAVAIGAALIALIRRASEEND